MDETAAELAGLARAPVTAGARARARELCARGVVNTAAARHHAALLLADSDDPADVQQALDLALLAMKEHRASRLLAARLFDRQLVLAGKPQKFGTQRGPDGALLPIDSATTDSERAKWGVPPRAELERGDGDSAP